MKIKPKATVKARNFNLSRKHNLDIEYVVHDVLQEISNPILAEVLKCETCFMQTQVKMTVPHQA